MKMISYMEPTNISTDDIGLGSGYKSAKRVVFTTYLPLAQSVVHVSGWYFAQQDCNGCMEFA